MFAIESINCPLTPKSQSFISPDEFIRIFEGLTSVEIKVEKNLTALKLKLKDSI